jgi:hypothetical protein
MGAAHPSEDDQSTPGRSLDEAYIEKARGRGDVQPEPDPRKEETTERWPLGKEGQVGVARKGPYARGAESIEMPSRGRRVYRIRQCTSPSSARQLWPDAPGEGSLHQHLAGGLSSFRSSSQSHERLLDPAYQFTAKMTRRI